MSKKIKYYVLMGFLGCALFVLFYGSFERYILSVNKPIITYEIQADTADYFEVFYNDGRGWNDKNRKRISLKGGGGFQKLVFQDFNTKNISKFRLDLGEFNSRVVIRSLWIHSSHDSIDVLQNLDLLKSNCIDYRPVSNGLLLDISCNDPYLIYEGQLDELQLGKYTTVDNIKIGAGILLAILLVVLAIRYKLAHGLIQKYKFSNLCFLILFGGFLSSHWYLKVSNIGDVDFTMENRRLTLFPEFGDEEFKNVFEDWFIDNLRIRQALVRHQSKLDYYLFDKSSMPQKVILGNNKEMFPTSNGILEDYLGEKKLDSAQLKSFKKNLTERIQYLQAKGMDYYLLFAPNKHSIYSKELPVKYRAYHKKSNTLLSQLMTYLTKDTLLNARIVDVRASLQTLAQQTTRRLYYKNDMHWNSYGAYYGYQALFNKIHETYPRYTPYAFSQFTVDSSQDGEGDLSKILLLTNVLKRNVFNFKLKDSLDYSLRASYSDENYPRYRTKCAQCVPSKALVFRDSYAQNLMQFISLHFSDVLYVWDQHFNDALIESYNPNLVIQEVTEMFIYELLHVNSEKVIHESKSRQ